MKYRILKHGTEHTTWYYVSFYCGVFLLCASSEIFLYFSTFRFCKKTIIMIDFIFCVCFMWYTLPLLETVNFVYRLGDKL